MSRKLTYEYVKEQIESEGYKLLSTEYINNKIKLKIQCPKGHIFYMSWANFKVGNRCSICSIESQRLVYKDVKEYIESYGYKLLSEKYINNHTKLEIRCPECHNFSMIFASFQQGQRCHKCFFESKRLTYKSIKNKIEKENYELISKSYKSASTKIKIKCDRGHVYKVTWNHFQQGYRCPICFREDMCKNYTEDELKRLENYRQCIKRLSEENFRRYYYEVNSDMKERGLYKYHLDHIYSVADGFKNGVLPEVIANINNLQILWWRDNVSKGGRSDQTIQDLYLGYYKSVLI